MAAACFVGRQALEALGVGMAGRAALTIGLGIVVYALALRLLAPEIIREHARSRAQAAAEARRRPPPPTGAAGMSRARPHGARPRSRSGSRSATIRTASGAASSRCWARTSTDLELVICDNASDDETAETLERYAREDRRVKVSLNPVNIGSHENMNRVLEASRGTLFRWISSDDWLEPGPSRPRCGARRAAGRDRGHLGLHAPHPGCRAEVRALRGRVPELLGSRRAVRAHALVLPRRRRQVRPDLRDLPAGAADAHRTRAPERAHRLAPGRRARPPRPIVHVDELLANRTQVYRGGGRQGGVQAPARPGPWRAPEDVAAHASRASSTSSSARPVSSDAQLRRCRRALRRFRAHEVVRVNRMRLVRRRSAEPIPR